MEQLIPPPSRRISEDEYLRLEESAKTKHEFRDGQLLDMASATTDHVSIATNLTARLHLRLTGGPCKVFNSDLRVRITERGNYVYPDATVVSGPIEYANPRTRTTMTNPRVVIEVTSESTEADDRGDKFTDYRRLASLQEYILIAQNRPHVETYYRQTDGIWAFGPSHTDLSEAVKFRSLNVELPLREIYSGIEFVVPPQVSPEQ